LPSIRASLNLTVEQESWIGSSPSFGGFIGSLMSGFTSKSVGARRGLLLCSLISCLGWLLIFLAAALSLLTPIFAGVFLIGFSSGFSNPLTTVYVSETVGKGNKGVVTSLFNCQATFGIMATNILGVLLGWLYNSLALGVIHCGFSLAAFIFLPATPYELVRTGHPERLIPLLKKLRGDQGESIDQEATFIIRQVEEEKQKPGFVTTIGRLNRRRVGIVLMMSIYCHLSGVGIVTAYLVDIFESTLNVLTLVLISSFTVVVGSCVQMCAADMLGRKVFLVFCGSGMGLASIIFAPIFWVSSKPESLIFGSSLLRQILSNNILVVLVLVLFLGSFQFGFGPMRYTLSQRALHPERAGNSGKPGPQYVLVLWFHHNQDIPPAVQQLRSRHHLRWHLLHLCFQHCFHPCSYS